MGLTATCSSCYSNKAYFNGVRYECPICKYKWNADIKSLKFDFYTNTERFESFFDKMDKLRTIESNSLDALKATFTPSWRFYKGLFLYAESGTEERFYTEICKTLILTNSYSEVIKIKPNQILSKDKTDSIINRAIKDYLESRDDLKFYPLPLECSQYINAPIDIIEEILKDRKPHLPYFLPMPDVEDFSIYFQGKMRKLYSNLKRKRIMMNYLSTICEMLLMV